MPLSSFSSLLDFAIKQQKDALDFFTVSLNKFPGKEELAKLRNEAEKNIKNLEVVLRENVSEIVMEPLEELNEADYSIIQDESDIPRTSINMLEKQKCFFQDAARVINLKEVKRIFEKMPARIDSLISEIK